MSRLPFRLEWKAIERPSGDQRGVAVSCAPIEVRRDVPDPSASQTQISGSPERVDAKAIFLPSGENCGWSSRYVEEISRVRFSGDDEVPVIASFQIFTSPSRRSYTSELPFRETAGLYTSEPAQLSCTGWPPATRILHKAHLSANTNPPP